MTTNNVINRYLTRFPLGAAFCFFAVVTAFVLATSFAVMDLLERREAVAAAADILSRLEGRAPSRPRVADAGDVTVVTGSPVLEGPTVTVAGAALMQRVAGAIARFGGNILSSQVDLQGPQAKDGFVSVAVNCEVEQASLQKILYDLEAGMPFLFVDQMVAEAPEGMTSAMAGKISRIDFGVRTMARCKMTMRNANQLLIATIALVAMGAATAGRPAQADSVAQDVNVAGTDLRQGGAQPPAAQATPGGNPVWAIPLSQLSATRERPIFSPSRRPPAVAVAAPIYVPAAVSRPVKAEPERPPLTLVGTITGENDAIAVFVVPGTATVVRLHTSDSHEGWTLLSVQGREATLQKGGASNVLALAPPGGNAEPVTAQALAEPARKRSRY